MDPIAEKVEKLRQVNTTKGKLEAAFTEWDRRFREEPERFQTESEHAAESAETYGQSAAAYLMQILAEQAA